MLDFTAMHIENAMILYKANDSEHKVEFSISFVRALSHRKKTY